MYKLDLTDQRFGKLVATNQLRRNKRGVAERLCHCDCGATAWAETGQLTNGHRKSCGCAPGMKLSLGESSRNSILNSYKQRARRCNLCWELSDEHFDILITGNCDYCGQPPSNLKKNVYGNGDFVYSGIDRVNNSLGYTDDNTVSCCSICNKAKGQMSREDFISWAKRVLGYTNEMS